MIFAASVVVICPSSIFSRIEYISRDAREKISASSVTIFCVTVFSVSVMVGCPRVRCAAPGLNYAPHLFLSSKADLAKNEMFNLMRDALL